MSFYFILFFVFGYNMKLKIFFFFSFNFLVKKWSMEFFFLFCLICSVVVFGC